MTESANSKNRGVVVWLALVCAMILGTVVVGGITRLTGSGLSIVEWKPVSGILPPLSDAAWQEAFAAYKKFPQYQKVNSTMTLSGFKFIFFWEYIHRILGRLIGVVFFVPFVFFLLRGKVSRGLAKRLVIAFFLGGLQGVLGWFMVKSGLVNQPSVSHYRLAAHLSLALFILIYLFWLILDLMPRLPLKSKPVRVMRNASFLITGLVMLQIVYGALMAGLKAGVGYNTFPKMNGHWVPAGLDHLSPGWLNFFENGMTVQFVHRLVAWLILAAVGGFWIAARRVLQGPSRRASHVLLSAVLCQFILGILTLVFVVPVPLASLHQMGAVAVLLAAIYLNHTLAVFRPLEL